MITKRPCIGHIIDATLLSVTDINSFTTTYTECPNTPPTCDINYSPAYSVPAQVMGLIEQQLGALRHLIDATTAD